MDSGIPTLIKDNDLQIHGEFFSIAEKISIRVAQLKENFKDRFPKIVIQND